MSKSKKYDSELYKIERKSYDYYEKIQDYEYSYFIANEMLHRTKSFKELFETKIALISSLLDLSFTYS